VHEVLRSPGQPLDPATRAFMEPRFGHDFSKVRVHADEHAAQSANAVDALAYTVGHDVVFASGRYAPHMADGRKLLAHELTHVVQHGDAQGGPALMPGELSMSSPNDPAEREAEGCSKRVVTNESPERISSIAPAALWRDIDPTRFHLVPDLRLERPPPPPLLHPGSIREAYVIPAPPHIELQLPAFRTGEDERLPRLLDEHLTPPTPFTPVTIIAVPRCMPNTPLTWSDFQGTAPATSTFGAETSAKIESIDVQGNTMFQATLDRSSSWVKPEFVNPTDIALNGCPARVAQCEAFFNTLPSNHTGQWRMNVGGCPAVILNTPSAVATNQGACATLIGAECNTNAPANSARLLAHEQAHFDLSCVLTNKANDALAAGRSLSSVGQAMMTKVPQQQSLYDGQTNHGCNPGPQATWTSNIASNLPQVTIP
jgi:hypothetical protein